MSSIRTALWHRWPLISRHSSWTQNAISSRCLSISQHCYDAEKHREAEKSKAQQKIAEARQRFQKFRSYPPPSLPNLEDSRETRLKRGLFNRFFDYLKGYGEILGRALPEQARKAVRLFSTGTKALFLDMKEFSDVFHLLTATSHYEKACKSLSRRQLELYLTLPGDMLRVAPVLIVSALPMAQNVVFPLAMMYPKQLLSSHFWTPEQKWEISVDKLKDRHKFYRLVLRDLQSVVPSFRGEDLHIETRRNLSRLGSGYHPNTAQILETKPLFEPGGVFHLDSLRHKHVRHLLCIHGLKRVSFYFPRYKLRQHANMILEIDRAMDREGLDNMSDKELLDSSFLRGLNPDGLDRDDMLDYLIRWTMVSLELDKRSLSLLLHLPILLGYNARTRFWTSAVM